ncbi:MAG: class I SAM-dependent methyltransferase [Chloroflexi bacterium]|nr:class I SAM-dependent methyltransferase [Chloroflexota bacterium]
MVAASEGNWFAGGEAYERYVGRWSRRVGQIFLDWLSLPAGLRWVDVGCGTGALTETILERTDPSSVTGVEPSEAFLSVARGRIHNNRAEFKSGDAMSLPLKDAEADVSVAGLVLNFVSDKQCALQELCRIIRPGGTVALYVWDYAGEMQLMRYFWNAVSELFPDGADYDEGKQFPICKPGPLADLFRATNLQAIDVRALDVPTVFVDFNDYWAPFLGGQGPAGSYCVSLPEDDREHLRKHLENSVPFRSDGTIHLIARAWGVRGTIPS